MIGLFCKTTWTELIANEEEALAFEVKKNKLTGRKILIVKYCKHYQNVTVITEANGITAKRSTLVDNPKFKKLFEIDIKSKCVTGFIKLFHDDFIKNCKGFNYTSTVTWG